MASDAAAPTAADDDDSDSRHIPPPSRDDPSPPPEEVSAGVLSREEILRRRSRRANRLIGFLRDCYWVLMEDTRIRYRDYYWRYGRSPLSSSSFSASSSGEEGGGGGGPHGCSFPSCKSKAMALSGYCFHHILNDPKQTLYKPCTYVVKSAPTGPVICGKPVLCSRAPSLCQTHLQKAHKHISQALKKAGLNAPSSSKLAPKFHVLVAEFVHQIQVKRSEKGSVQDNDIDKAGNIG